MAINKMNETYRAISRSTFDKWNLSCDVIVVGMGCAGVSAAVEAAENGADVLILERFNKGGGTTALSGAQIYLGGGTSLQIKHGFEDSVEDMYNYLAAASGPEPDLERIDIYCQESASHFQWLCERNVPFGEDFFPGGYERPGNDGLTWSGSERSYPFNRIASAVPRAHIVQAQGGTPGGAVLVQRLASVFEGVGGQIIYNANTQNLVVDQVGEVLGVRVLIDGEQYFVEAHRGVVLTAGGFIHNREMVNKYAPVLAKSHMPIGAEGDDGSGILMGLSVGAAAIRMDAGSVTLPIYPPVSLKQGILVNCQGQRFINEDCYMGRVGEYALYHQQGKVYLLVDDKVLAMPEYWQSEILCSSENIADIERQCSFPEGALQITLDYYNTFAEQGEDPLFHKESDYLTALTTPPYHLLDVSTDRETYSTFTLGGLHTQTGGEVLRPNGQVINGLYAAGRTVSGIAKLGYSSGTSLGDGTFFGRKAGMSAASRRD